MVRSTVTPLLAAATSACSIGVLSNCSSSAQRVVPGRADPIRLTNPVWAPGDQINSEPLGTTPLVGGALVLLKSVLKVASTPDTVAGLFMMTAKSRNTG